LTGNLDGKPDILDHFRLHFLEPFLAPGNTIPDCWLVALVTILLRHDGRLRLSLGELDSASIFGIDTSHQYLGGKARYPSLVSVEDAQPCLG